MLDKYAAATEIDAMIERIKELGTQALEDQLGPKVTAPIFEAARRLEKALAALAKLTPAR